MIEIGPLAINLALVLAAYAIVMSLLGAWRGRRDFVASAEHAVLAVWASVLIATVALLHALVVHYFRLEYVAGYSSSTLPLYYTVAALWGGQKGSLLWWLLILTSMSAVVVLQNREKNRDLMPYVMATLMAVALFFSALLVFITPPFELLAVPAKEGRDLNPLLQNYWMTIHPPSLYLGFVGMTVPFAFAIAALASGKLGDVWIRTTRRWTLFAWFFLSLGNLFGALWAFAKTPPWAAQGWPRWTAKTVMAALHLGLQLTAIATVMLLALTLANGHGSVASTSSVSARRETPTCGSATGWFAARSRYRAKPYTAHSLDGAAFSST